MDSTCFGKTMSVSRSVQMVGMASFLILPVLLVQMDAQLAPDLYRRTVMRAQHSIIQFITKIAKAVLVIKRALQDNLLMHQFLMFVRLVMFNAYTVQLHLIIAHILMHVL